jgi:hypothetical protein
MIIKISPAYHHLLISKLHTPHNAHQPTHIPKRCPPQNPTLNHHSKTNNQHEPNVKEEGTKLFCAVPSFNLKAS